MLNLLLLWPRWVGCRWEGGKFKREGIYVYTEFIHFVIQQKLMQHYKTIVLQLKKRRALPPKPLLALSLRCQGSSRTTFPCGKAAHCTPVPTICWELHFPVWFLHMQLPSIYHHWVYRILRGKRNGLRWGGCSSQSGAGWWFKPRQQQRVEALS